MCNALTAWRRRVRVSAKGTCRHFGQIAAQVLKHIGAEVDHALDQDDEHGCAAHVRVLLDVCFDLSEGVNLGITYGDQQLWREDEAERQGREAGRGILYCEGHAHVQRLALSSEPARSLDYLQRIAGGHMNATFCRHFGGLTRRRIEQVDPDRPTSSCARIAGRSPKCTEHEAAIGPVLVPPRAGNFRLLSPLVPPQPTLWI